MKAKVKITPSLPLTQRGSGTRINPSSSRPAGAPRPVRSRLTRNRRHALRDQPRRSPAPTLNRSPVAWCAPTMRMRAVSLT